MSTLVLVLVFLLLSSHVASADRGKDLFESGDFEGALAAYEEILSANPKDSSASYNRLACLYSLKRYDEVVRVREPRDENQGRMIVASLYHLARFRYKTIMFMRNRSLMWVMFHSSGN